MAVRRRRRNRARRFIAPVATMVLLSYFGFHALNGKHGLRAQIVMTAKEKTLRTTLAARTAKREALEQRLALLQDGSMHRDMIDEFARRQLNMTQTRDVVFLVD